MNISFINNKIIRKELFNNSENTNKSIELNDSIYNYRYIYIEGDNYPYYTIIPIYSKSQTNLVGIGGWTGVSGNAGTTQIKATVDASGKNITIETFLSIVHNQNSSHQESIERLSKKVIGIK